METGYQCPHCGNACFAPRPGRPAACPNCRRLLPVSPQGSPARRVPRWAGVALGCAVLGVAAFYYGRMPAPAPPAPSVAPRSAPVVTPPRAPLARARNGDWTCFVDRLDGMPRERMFLHGWLQKDGGPSPSLPACRIAVRDARGEKLSASDSRRRHTRFGEEFQAVLPRPRRPFVVEVTFVPGEPRADVTLPGYTPVMVPTRVQASNGRVDVLVRTSQPPSPIGPHMEEWEITSTAGERVPVAWLVNAQGAPVVAQSLDEIDSEPLNAVRYRCEWTDADTPLTLKLLSERSAREQQIRLVLRGIRPPSVGRGDPA